MASTELTPELVDMSNLNWRRETSDDTFLISTRYSMLHLDFINTIYATPDMSWTKPMPIPILQTMLQHSIVLGLYKVHPAIPPASTSSSPSSPTTPSPTLEAPPEENYSQIGMTRFVTDHVSIAYLSDVYIIPSYRGKGLAKWLMACCREVLRGHPMMRRLVVTTITGSPGLEFYSREFSMQDSRERAAEMRILLKDDVEFEIDKEREMEK